MKQADLLRRVRQYARHPYTDLGGYPLILFMQDSEALCPDCTKTNYKYISESTRHFARDGWQAAGIDIYYEGPSLACCHCGAEIESAYGDPEAENNEALS